MKQQNLSVNEALKQVREINRLKSLQVTIQHEIEFLQATLVVPVSVWERKTI